MNIEDKIHIIKKARITKEEILVQYIVDNCLFDDDKSTDNSSYWIYNDITAFRFDKEGRYKNHICLNSEIRKFLQDERNLEKDDIKQLVSFCINKSKLINTPIVPEKVVFFNFE